MASENGAVRLATPSNFSCPSFSSRVCPDPPPHTRARARARVRTHLTPAFTQRALPHPPIPPPVRAVAAAPLTAIFRALRKKEPWLGADFKP
eukprot:SAG11_NODE_5221_length_1626_cov_1.277014_1_plen_92_part_00